MVSPAYTSDMIVAELLSENPACIRPFLDHKMLCVGCPVARFHSIAYACDKHDVDLGQFLVELSEVSA